MEYHWRLLTAGDTDVPGLKLSPKPSARKVTTSVLQPGTYMVYVSAAGNSGKGPTTAPAARQVVVPEPGTVDASAADCNGTGKVDNGSAGANNALVAGGIPQIKSAVNPSEARTGLLTQLSAVQSSPRKLVEAIEINLHQQVSSDDLFKGSCLTQTAVGYATQMRLLLSDQRTTVVTATAPKDGIAAGWDGKQVVQASSLPDDRKAVSVQLADKTRYWVLWVNGDWVLPPAGGASVQAEASAPASTTGQQASASSSSVTGSSSGSGSGQSATSSTAAAATTAASASSATAAGSTFGESQQQAVQQAAAIDQRNSARATQASAPTTAAAAPTTSVAASTATVDGTPAQAAGGGDPNGSAASASAGTSWSGCGISGNCP